jgi:hypothetical protein
MSVRFGEVLPWTSLGGVVALSTAVALAASALKHALALPPLGALLVTGCAYTALYVALLLRSGLLSSAEKAALSGLVRRAGHSAGLAAARA